MGIKLILGDCREELRKLEGVALFATSPPYAQGLEYEAGLDWDGLRELMGEVAGASYGAAKDGGFFWVNFGETTKYPRTMAELYNDAFREAGWVMHSRRVWVKSFARCALTGAMINRTIPAAEFEHLWTWRKPPMVKEKHRDKTLSLRGVWTCSEGVGVKKDEHPAAFPVELPEKAIKVWTDEGDLVCDPFMGSGSTAIACLRLGREFVGIERDEGYMGLAEERIGWEERGLKRPEKIIEEEGQISLFG